MESLFRCRRWGSCRLLFYLLRHLSSLLGGLTSRHRFLLRGVIGYLADVALRQRFPDRLRLLVALLCLDDLRRLALLGCMDLRGILRFRRILTLLRRYRLCSDLSICRLRLLRRLLQFAELFRFSASDYPIEMTSRRLVGIRQSRL